MNIILGSKSTSRRQLLKDAHYEFITMSADIDEKAIRSTNFVELPKLLATAKAEALLGKIKKNSILITSDQIVVCNGELREKPLSRKQAEEYLKSYSKYPAQTITAVVVTNTKDGKRASGTESAKVYFKEIPDLVVAAAIKDGQVMTAAGGFMIEHPMLEKYIDHIEGTIDSIKGLPLNLVEKLIAEVS